MRFVLVGEVRTAEFGLRGLLRAGCEPARLITTDTARVQPASGMAPEYYADLIGLGREHGLATTVVDAPGEIAGVLAELAPDYVYVLGWPYLVRQPVLDIAPCIGMHPTRLPARRGGAPLNWTILDGERESAVSLLRLRNGVDDGELLAQREFAIGPDDYVGDLVERVYAITEELVASTARALADGGAQWRTQEHACATYTRRRKPEDGRIAWCDSAPRIRNLVRAVSRPYPGAFTFLEATRLTIWRAEVPRGYRAPLRAVPGQLLEVNADGVLVATRDNALRLTELTCHDAEGGELPLESLGVRVGEVLG